MAGVVGEGHEATVDRFVDVRVGEDEVRAFAAELEADGDDPFGSNPAHLTTGTDGTGERHAPHLFVGDQGLAHSAACPGDDVENAVVQADFGG